MNSTFISEDVNEGINGLNIGNISSINALKMDTFNTMNSSSSIKEPYNTESRGRLSQWARSKDISWRPPPEGGMEAELAREGERPGTRQTSPDAFRCLSTDAFRDPSTNANGGLDGWNWSAVPVGAAAAAAGETRSGRTCK